MIRTTDLRGAADPHAVANVPQMPQGGGETAITAAAAKAKALVEARYEVAFHRPRDFDQVREKLLKECRRPSFAQVAEYAKPIGGDKVRGPSIRMAEAAIRCMTNLVISTTTWYDDPQKRIVNVSIVDLETNIPYDQDVTIEKSIERRSKKDGDIVLRERLNSSGQKLYIIVADDDAILNKQNALISKALRTQALRLVPGDLIDEAMTVARQTRSKEDAKDPDSAKRAIYDAFSQVGVRVEQIKEYLGHDGNTLTPSELDTLRALYAALRDSETTWREIMDARDPPKPKEGASAAAKAQAVVQAVSKPAEPTLDPQKEAIAKMQAESFREGQQAQSGAAHEERHHNEEAREARANNGRTQQKAADLPPQQTASFDAGAPQNMLDESEKKAAAEGRPTFNEIIKAIGNADSAEHIRDVIIPMIGEIPNEKHRNMLQGLADNKIQALAGGDEPNRGRQAEPPAKPAVTSRTRRNVEME